MLYLNSDYILGTDSGKNLTLTSVVFELTTICPIFRAMINLTLTSVVFEYNVPAIICHNSLI